VFAQALWQKQSEIFRKGDASDYTKVQKGKLLTTISVKKGAAAGENAAAPPSLTRYRTYQLTKNQLFCISHFSESHE